MPNNCANRLIVTGPAKDIAKFRRDAERELTPEDKGRREPFDIFRFLPVPKELNGIFFGFIKIDGIEYEVWREVKQPDGSDKSIGISPVEKKRLVAKHGAACSYDWCLANLGTKWGTYKSELVLDNKTELIYRYQTAWSPLSPAALMTMAVSYPSLTFMVQFAERGACFAGEQILRKGIIVKDERWNLEPSEFDEEGNYLTRNAYSDLVEQSG